MFIYIVKVFKHLKFYSKFLSILNYILGEVEGDSGKKHFMAFLQIFNRFYQIL